MNIIFSLHVKISFCGLRRCLLLFFVVFVVVVVVVVVIDDGDGDDDQSINQSIKSCVIEHLR